MPPSRQHIKQEAPLREEEAPLREQEFYDNDWDSLSALEQELADYEDATTFPESFAGESYAGSTVVPERPIDADAMSMFSRAESARLPGQVPPPPPGRDPYYQAVPEDYEDIPPPPDFIPPPPVNVVEQEPFMFGGSNLEPKQEGAGIGKRLTRFPKDILKSYTTPRHTPGPRAYAPPRPEFRRQTNEKDREAILKIIDAVRLILN
jgi:hypothetical protein